MTTEIINNCPCPGKCQIQCSTSDDRVQVTCGHCGAGDAFSMTKNKERYEAAKSAAAGSPPAFGAAPVTVEKPTPKTAKKSSRKLKT